MARSKRSQVKISETYRKYIGSVMKRRHGKQYVSSIVAEAFESHFVVVVFDAAKQRFIKNPGWEYWEQYDLSVQDLKLSDLQSTDFVTYSMVQAFYKNIANEHDSIFELLLASDHIPTPFVKECLAKWRGMADDRGIKRKNSDACDTFCKARNMGHIKSSTVLLYRDELFDKWFVSKHYDDEFCLDAARFWLQAVDTTMRYRIKSFVGIAQFRTPLQEWAENFDVPRANGDEGGRDGKLIKMIGEATAEDAAWRAVIIWCNEAIVGVFLAQPSRGDSFRICLRAVSEEHRRRRLAKWMYEYYLDSFNIQEGQSISVDIAGCQHRDKGLQSWQNDGFAQNDTSNDGTTTLVAEALSPEERKRRFQMWSASNYAELFPKMHQDEGTCMEDETNADSNDSNNFSDDDCCIADLTHAKTAQKAEDERMNTEAGSEKKSNDDDITSVSDDDCCIADLTHAKTAVVSKIIRADSHSTHASKAGNAAQEADAEEKFVNEAGGDKKSNDDDLVLQFLQRRDKGTVFSDGDALFKSIVEGMIGKKCSPDEIKKPLCDFKKFLMQANQEFGQSLVELMQKLPVTPPYGMATTEQTSKRQRMHWLVNQGIARMETGDGISNDYLSVLDVNDQIREENDDTWFACVASVGLQGAIIEIQIHLDNSEEFESKTDNLQEFLQNHSEQVKVFLYGFRQLRCGGLCMVQELLQVCQTGLPEAFCSKEIIVAVTTGAGCRQKCRAFIQPGIASRTLTDQSLVEAKQQKEEIEKIYHEMEEVGFAHDVLGIRYDTPVDDDAFNEKVCYIFALDSLGFSADDQMNIVEEYLVSQIHQQDQLRHENPQQYVRKANLGLAQQKNGYDCGLYTCNSAAIIASALLKREKFFKRITTHTAFNAPETFKLEHLFGKDSTEGEISNIRKYYKDFFYDNWNTPDKPDYEKWLENVPKPGDFTAPRNIGVYDTGKGKIDLTEKELSRLHLHADVADNYLNDELVNVLMHLMVRGDEKHAEIKEKIHTFSTYFLQNLKGNVKDLFEKDVLFFPCHCNGNHWRLIVVIRPGALIK